MPRVRKKDPDPGGRRKLPLRELVEEDASEEEHLLRTEQCQENIVEEDIEHGLATSVIKMKLAQFVPDPDIRSKLNSLVRDANILMGEAYLFANFHTLRLLEENKPVPSIDRNLYYRCLLAVANTNARPSTLGEELAASVQAFDALRPEVDQVHLAHQEGSKKPPKDPRKIDALAPYWNQILADLSISMATMATNHLWTNLATRLARFLKWRFPDIKEGLRKTIVKSIVDEPRTDLAKLFASPRNAKPELLARHQAAQHIASELRQLAPLPSKRRSAKLAALTLPLYRHILAETEAEAARRAAVAVDTQAKLPDGNKKRSLPRLRLFTMLPTKSGFTTSHVQFSRMALLLLLKEMGKAKFERDGRFLQEDDLRKLWASHFHVSRFETRSRRFKHRFSTDGCAISVVTTKMTSLVSSEETSNAAELKLLAKDTTGCVTFAGVDPGVTDVVTVAFRGEDTPVSYSAARYYEQANYNTSRRCISLWNADTQSSTAGLAGGGATASLQALSEHARIYMAVLRSLVEHRMQRGYRNMRFLRYVYKKRAIEDICDVVAPKDKVVVVGFGDWKGLGKSPIKRRCAGPLQEIKQRLVTRPNVVMTSIAETRTSKVCHGCFQELCNMRAKSVVFRRLAGSGVVERCNDGVKKIHKVLHCKSSKSVPASAGRCGTTWNRDANAAKNILMLLMMEALGMDRPGAFCHQPRTSKKKQ